MKGVYRMKESGRIRCGGTVFGYDKGHQVEVTQVDSATRKVLVSFGERMQDWFHESILSKMEKEQAQ